MKERLVDVKRGQRVLHTFPVALSGPLAGKNDEPFKQKALEAAANAKLVDSGELSALTADMHAGRGGPAAKQRISGIKPNMSVGASVRMCCGYV